MKISIFVKICTFVLVVLYFSSMTIAYKMEVEENKITPVHQVISKEACYVTDIPYEMKKYCENAIDEEIVNGKYDNNDDIITASAEEDRDFWRSTVDMNGNHFWNPDTVDSINHWGEYDFCDGLAGYTSSYCKAKEYWETKVIKYYKEGKIDESYYWLGRVAHLLEDSSASSHILLDQHLDDTIGVTGNIISNSEYEYYDDSILEEYTGNHYDDYTADDLEIIGKPYYYENLISSWNYDDWLDLNPDLEKNDYPSNLFKLFWYTGQKTQYWASDDIDGNNYYINSNNDLIYLPNLWSEEGITPNSQSSVFRNKPLDSSNEDFYYSLFKSDTNCQFITGTICQTMFGQNQCYYCNTNDGPYIQQEANALIPHSMRSVAGLYKLFWDSVHSYDWPMYGQNLQRTGMTILRGSIDGSSLRQTNLALEGVGLDEDGVYVRDKPSIGDVDSDGVMEIVTTSSLVGLESESKIYASKCKDKCKTKTPVFATINGYPYKSKYPIVANPSIVNLDGKKGNEIVAASVEEIIVLNGENGVPKFTPYHIETKRINTASDYMAGEIYYTAVVDYDLDGENEILFADAFPDYRWKSELYAISNELKNESNITIGNGMYSAGPYGALAVANLNQVKDECSGLDYPEIIVPNIYGINIYRYDNCTNGLEEVTSYAVNGVYSTPVIADIDMNNEYEIIFATSNATTCYDVSGCENKLFVLDSNAELKASISISNYAVSDLAVGRIDSDDSDMEIVISTRDSNTYYNQDHTPHYSNGQVRVYSYLGSSLTNLASFTDSGSLDTSRYAPAIADIDGSGRQDIIFGDWEENVYAIELQGTSFETLIKTNIGLVTGTPAIGDWDDDGSAEIAVRNKKKASGTSIQEFQTEFQTLSNFYTETYHNSDPYRIERFIMQSGDTEITLISENNTKPFLIVPEQIIAMEGENVTINASGTDDDNNTLTYYFASPFNENGTWKSVVNDSGRYDILVTVSDGNLSDSQYVDLFLLRNDSTKLNISNQTFVSNTSVQGQINFSLKNETRIWLADFRIKGGIINTTQSNYSYGDGIIKEYNGWSNTSPIYNINNSVDKNESTYYSAGEATGLIVELNNLTIPNNTAHIIVKLKLRISDGGSGRFGIYNYAENVTEIITSSIPIIIDDWIYFDIYSANTSLWSSNDTHYSYKVDNINNFVSNNSVRWYYRYKFDTYADQRVYESMVSFKEAEVYPEDVTVKLNNKTIFKTDELFETTAKTTAFNDSTSNQSLILSNNTITKYIKIPKNAVVTKSVISMGNMTTNDINATAYDVIEENFQIRETSDSTLNTHATKPRLKNSLTNITLYGETVVSNEFSSMAYCSDWYYTAGGVIDHMHYGPYCADGYSWHNSDVDSDGYSEKYMLKGETYKVWAECTATTNPSAIVFSFDDCWEADPIYCSGNTHYGCYDGNCNQQTERTLWQTNYNSVSSNIYFPDMVCHAESSQYYTAAGWDGGDLSLNYSGHFEPYLVLECGVNSDCADNKYCNHHSTTDPLQYTCDTPSCSPSCSEWEYATYSSHACSCALSNGRCDTSKYGWTNVADDEYCNMTSHYPSSVINITCDDWEVSFIENHVQQCGIGPGRCETPNVQINESAYCDSQNYIQKISTYIKVDDTNVGLNIFTERLELEITNTLNNYLEDCAPDEEGNCLIPINFYSEYNMTANINSVEINYETKRIEITDKLQQYLLNNTKNFTLNIQSQKGKISLEDFRIYSSPNTPPRIINASVTGTEGENITISYDDRERDTLTADINNEEFTQNNKQLIWQTDYQDAGDYTYLINISDGLYSTTQNISVNIINDWTKDVEITSFDYFTMGDLNKVMFYFTLLNNNPENKSMNYILQTGEQNISTNFTIPLSQTVMGFIQYNYSTSNDFNVILSSTNNNASDSIALVLSTKQIKAENLSRLSAYTLNSTYEFLIRNNGDINLSNITWSFNTGQKVINSTQNFNLNPDERIFVFINTNYTSTGYYNVTSIATQSGASDSKTILVSLGQVYIKDYQILSSSRKEDVFGFKIENAWNTSLSNVSWRHENGESNISSNNFNLSLGENIFAFVYHNYTNNGNFSTKAVAKYGAYEDSEELTLEVG